MNNGKVCEYVRTIEPHKNNIGEEYISDLCVKQGYGQSCGGYLKTRKKDDIKLAEPSQKEHFLNYYEDKSEKLPTYYYLRCPQLLLFIAEIAGVSRKSLKGAYKKVRDYENANKLRYKEKNANYMWGKKAFRDFKSQIHISDVVRIIRDAENWHEVREKALKLKKVLCLDIQIPICIGVIKVRLCLVKLDKKYKKHLNDMIEEWYATGEKIIPYAIRRLNYLGFVQI